MTFLVTGAGHSGTKWLATQLAKAEGWTIFHEPDDAISARLVASRFAGRFRYGEVNSFLLSSARYLPATQKAVILRNPYEIAKSVARTRGHNPQDAVSYVRECLSTLDCLIRDGFQIIRFRPMVTDTAYLLRCARRLGIITLHKGQIGHEKINEHSGPTPVLPINPTAQEEFNEFIDLYGVP